MNLSIQIIVVIFLIWLSAFFAGSETGVYRLSRIRLRLGLQQRKPLYKLLAGIIHDSHGLMISLLIGNNIANYLTTSIVTYMLLSQIDNPHQAEFYATLIMTPVLFVFVDMGSGKGRALLVGVTGIRLGPQNSRWWLLVLSIR